MRHLFLYGILIGLYACGSSSSNYRNRANLALSKQAPTTVNSANELPECSLDRIEKLIYVRDLDAFKLCLGSTWVDADSTAQIGDIGIKESNSPGEKTAKTIAKSNINLCGEAPNKQCTFEGGKIVQYLDGTIRYTTYSNVKTFYNNIDTVEKIAVSDTKKSSILHQISWTSSQIKIFDDVARNGEKSNIFINFDAEYSKFTIFFDRNKDDNFSLGDEILLQPEIIE